MSAQSKPNACLACAKAKRRCGRQMPCCARCRGRGMNCVYPQVTNTARSLYRPLLSSALSDNKRQSPEEDTGTARPWRSHSKDQLTRDLMYQTPYNNSRSSPLLDHELSALSSKVDWFVAAETWEITRRFDSTTTAPANITTMQVYLAEVKSWMERWFTTGSNPFIHAKLYSARFPACVQVAYTTLGSYIHRSPSNTNAILQIVEERSTDLLRENGCEFEIMGIEHWSDKGELELDLFSQLARLHALMIYQIIGLFDGDIRSRHVAEGRLAVQNSWARKLLYSAERMLSNSQGSQALKTVDFLPKPSVAQGQWHLWILSESIRRSWLIAASISPIFCALQQRWATCPGGIMYTSRDGLWAASSAIDWEARCSSTDMRLLQRFGCTSILDQTQATEVDEFGLAIMSITYHQEVLERWKGSSFTR